MKSGKLSITIHSKSRSRINRSFARASFAQSAAISGSPEESSARPFSEAELVSDKDLSSHLSVVFMDYKRPEKAETQRGVVLKQQVECPLRTSTKIVKL